MLLVHLSSRKLSPLLAEYFGITSHGALFGILAFSGTVGGSLRPFVAGYLDITSGYGPAFSLFTLTIIVGLFLMILLKPISSRE